MSRSSRCGQPSLSHCKTGISNTMFQNGHARGAGIGLLVTAVLESAGPGLATSVDVELDASVLAKVAHASLSDGGGGGGRGGRLGGSFRHVDGFVWICIVD